MRLPARNIIITLFCALALFFVGINYYIWLSEVLVPPVDGAIFDVTKVISPFEQSLPFACILAVIPVMCLIVWLRVPINNIAKRIASVLLIVGSVVAAILIRRYFFQIELNELARQTETFRINPQVTAAFDNLNMEYWMIVGLLAGCALSFLFFRKKQYNGYRNTRINKKI